MAKPTDIRILEVKAGKTTVPYRTPMKFGGRVVTEAVLFSMTIEVETRDGRTAQGTGMIPLGATWAWPTDAVSLTDAQDAMVAMGQQVAMRTVTCEDWGHPLELTHQLAQQNAEAAERVRTTRNLEEPIPRLAQLVCASPMHAALHDAYGKAIGENSYNLLGAEFVNRDLAAYLTPEFAGEYLDRYTLRTPKKSMPLYHLVGALDPLTPADVQTPIGDGLPDTLGEWIARDGLTHLKIKLSGDDVAWDVARVAAVDRVAHAATPEGAWRYSLDFNERCANVETILELFARLNEQSPAAFERVVYVEQPTHRDLRAHPENRMHKAAAIKPVVIDESLVDLESLELAVEQGYSGVALKTCKGHTDALLMAAVAQKRGLFLCVQDLTCPGAAFLHSASLAARIPTVAAIEGNARQYCPAASKAWQERRPDLFEVSDGQIHTGTMTAAGLGF
jgi:L-alanine-DL-glutamate epimerase-like enolase superfamily enzyme